MKNIFTILLLLCTFQIGYTQVALSPAEAQVLKEKVLTNAENTKTITSDFVQKKHLDFLASDIETMGSMHFKSPNLLKWAYTDPYQYSVVFKDEQLHVNDDGAKSEVNLQGNKMFQSLNDLLAKSIKGDMFNEEEFGIAYFKMEDNYLVKFHPLRKELKKYIKTFELTFAATDGNVLAVKMIEPSDDYTQIIFNNRVLNVPISDAVFVN